MAAGMVFLGLSGEVFGEEKGFYEDHARGWHWYERMDTPQEEEKKEAEKPAASPEGTGWKERLDRYRKNLEELQARAVMDPTAGNVEAYMREQNRVIRRGEHFGKMWQWLVARDPELDADVSDPKSQRMRHVVYAEERKRKEERIRALSKTHGLMFFYTSRCSFCHAMADVVRAFSRTYGWSVLAVAVDGEELEGFERTVRDQGQAASLGVTRFPTVLALDTRTRDVIALATGARSMEEMVDRAWLLTEGAPVMQEGAGR